MCGAWKRTSPPKLRERDRPLSRCADAPWKRGRSGWRRRRERRGSRIRDRAAVAVVDEIDAGVDAFDIRPGRTAECCGAIWPDHCQCNSCSCPGAVARPGRAEQGCRRRGACGSRCPTAETLAASSCYDRLLQLLFRRGRTLKLQHGFIGGEEESVARAASQELDLGIGLALVGLEVERQRQARGGNWRVRGGSMQQGLIGCRILRASFDEIACAEAERRACNREYDRRNERCLHPPDAFRMCHRISCRRMVIPIHRTPPNSQACGGEKNQRRTPHGATLHEADAHLLSELGLKQMNTFTSQG